ncbi:MAG: MFS transporter [Novosphingobium sp.]|nr:MFS transporter [Novosphingobium sp.]
MQNTRKTGWYRWYIVGVLAIAGALAQIDRQIMGLLTEPVKADLQLSDIQISLLQGLAFVLFHAVMAFPLGYLSDKWPRRFVMATGILLWSMATMACGLARSFVQLFAARLGVGVGEASLIPSVQSLLPDHFKPDELSKAFAVFQFGLLIGGGGAYIVGGLMLSLIDAWNIQGLPLLGELRPWQITFILAALPGPVIALLMLTMREAPRLPAATNDTRHAPDGFRRFLAMRRWFLISHLGSIAAKSIIVFGIVAWVPSFLVRTFEWTVAEAGLAYGAILLVFGGSGTLISAQVAQIWTKRSDRSAVVKVNLLAFLVTLPVAVAFPLVSSAQVALALLAIFSFCVGVTSTMMPTILQLATPDEYRGRIAAFYVFATTAIGAALGPMAIATVTDFVLGDTQRLREAIAIVSCIFGVIVIALGLSTYREFRKLTAQGG